MVPESGAELGEIRKTVLHFEDRVTFVYDGEIRVGTVQGVKIGTLLLKDDDRKGQFRSFRENKIDKLVVL